MQRPSSLHAYDPRHFDVVHHQRPDPLLPSPTSLEVGSGGVGWGWGSTLTHNYGGLRRGGGGTQQLSN